MMKSKNLGKAQGIYRKRKKAKETSRHPTIVMVDRLDLEALASFTRTAQVASPRCLILYVIVIVFGIIVVLSTPQNVVGAREQHPLHMRFLQFTD